MWEFIQDQILGMKWLERMTGRWLEAAGVDTGGRLGGSLHFFIYDGVKIMTLLCALVFVVSYIQSHFPPSGAAAFSDATMAFPRAWSAPCWGR